jgi:nicotinamidase-related amidase
MDDDVTADDAQMYAERGFGKRLGFGDRPALIVIDLIRAFTNPSGPLGSDLAAQLACTRQLLDSARSARLPVYFTTVSYDDGNLEDAGTWAQKIGGLDTLRTGSPEVEVDPALGRRADEHLIVKKYASAFFGTDLSSRLISRSIDTVIIAGATTSGCVRATAVDAIQSGLRPIVPADAVGDRSQIAHEQSLRDMEAKYADVTTTDADCAHLAGLAVGGG